MSVLFAGLILVGGSIVILFGIGSLLYISIQIAKETYQDGRKLEGFLMSMVPLGILLVVIGEIGATVTK